MEIDVPFQRINRRQNDIERSQCFVDKDKYHSASKITCLTLVLYKKLKSLVDFTSYHCNLLTYYMSLVL